MMTSPKLKKSGLSPKVFSKFGPCPDGTLLQRVKSYSNICALVDA